jgi:DedD protein
VSDAADELEKKARRRLVGAVVLALIAVTVLPLTMDEAPPSRSPYSNDIQLSSPEHGEVRVAPQFPPPEDERPDADVEPVLPSDAQQIPPPAPVPSSPPAADEALPSLAAVETGERIRDAEAARIQALLDGVAPGQDGAHVIQVGAFGDAIKAAAVVSKLKQQGFTAYTEKVGNMTRVRIGAVPDRREGERMAARLKTLGYEDAVMVSR